MNEHKAWIFNRDGGYECEFVGPVDKCLEYIREIEPMFGWVISDHRNIFVCSGKVPEAWRGTVLS